MIEKELEKLEPIEKDESITKENLYFFSNPETPKKLDVIGYNEGISRSQYKKNVNTY